MSSQDRRRFPRLLLAHPEGLYQPIPDIKVIWEDHRGSARVLDLSYAGLAVESEADPRMYRLGQRLALRLVLPDVEPIPLDVTLVRIGETSLGLKLESTSVEGRLKIDQFLKDQLVGQSLRKMDPELLSESHRCDVWYHGAFDTNLFIWSRAGKLEKAWIEYDSVVLELGEGIEESRVARALSTVASESSAYMTSVGEAFDGAKARLGVSWGERFLQLLARIPDPVPELIEVRSRVEQLLRGSS